MASVSGPIRFYFFVKKEKKKKKKKKKLINSLFNEKGKLVATFFTSMIVSS
jgi:preprotein translocase subunit YajC